MSIQCDENGELSLLEIVNELNLKLYAADPIISGGFTEQVAVGSTQLDASLGTIQTIDMIGDTTFTSVLTSGQSITVILTGGPFVVTWPAGMRWVGGEPTLTEDDTLVFYNVNDILWGSYSGANV